VEHLSFASYTVWLQQYQQELIKKITQNLGEEEEKEEEEEQRWILPHY